ncbi:Serine phosphatase RsbU, regulator of sigma subunit [Pseudobacteriovorax antillogorgiicola]|uniref:Serine phosphatase RsbU, regulator of sigma subunit n=1 Tax=Pseudobacteriovorax antillogorgiicola TaxID=1513793 RepID=A0A1Y6BG04_9BACT|nr:serine phosphatase RsbU (regulator of sigma subunit) [Pseudobacteriovorax antillogorgiicola]SMF02379.1 Serine phosphatase RsbU, regulator of sigma subunit [Pseudobacteriovorax antillogorgiicola]
MVWDHAEEELSLRGQKISDAILHDLRLITHSLEFLAITQEIRLGVSSLVFSGAARRVLERYQERYPMVTGIYLFDESANVVETIPEILSIEDSEYITNALASLPEGSREIFVDLMSNSDFSEILRELSSLNRVDRKSLSSSSHILVGKPVIGDKSRRVGFLVLVIPIEVLLQKHTPAFNQDRVLDIQKEEQTWYNSLLDTPPRITDDTWIKSITQLALADIAPDQPINIRLITAETKSSRYGEIFEDVQDIVVLVTLISLLTLALAFHLGRLIAKPLARIGDLVSAYKDANYSYRLPKMKFVEFSRLVDLLGDLGEAVRNSKTDLNRKLDERSEEIHRLQKKERDAAKAVQEALLRHPEIRSRVTITSCYRTAGFMGGDWYSYFEDTTKNRLVVMIGDVTGHDMSSALVTGAVAGASRAGLEVISDHENDHKNLLHQIADKFNQVVIDTGKCAGHLMTMTILCIDTLRHRCHYLNAGHTGIALKNKSGVRTIIKGGSPLGLFEQPNFGYCEFPLNVHDTLFLYTDGLLENASQAGSTISPRMLLKTLEDAADARSMIDAITGLTVRVWGDQKIEDDCTYLAIQYRP